MRVNIDHIATVRQARGTRFPEVIHAALVAEQAGADGITVHLREDRRHIQERDVRLLCERARTKVNLEMAATPEMVKFAARLSPDDACFVPEKRRELTTEGGLDVVLHKRKIKDAVARLHDRGIHVALFIDPARTQIECARAVGAHAIEIHTGTYCNQAGARRAKELRAIIAAAKLARRLGLEVHGGHGLNYENVLPIAKIAEIVELNIGHSIVARALFVGLEKAVREMKELLVRARG
ncbi:MAG: pyridoxine 5'-phosphate synthase [Deltaproteobacteria bacterium]|nr:pyridoxine 5'-phosphate synthase [Deltaproteobacteria bacterium]